MKNISVLTYNLDFEVFAPRTIEFFSFELVVYSPSDGFMQSLE